VKWGFDGRIMAYFVKHGVSYILKSTNANSITMVVWDNPKSWALIDVLKEVFYQVKRKADGPCLRDGE